MQPEAPRFSPVPEEVLANIRSERPVQLRLLHDARSKQAKLPERRSDFLQGVWDRYQAQIQEAERRLRGMTAAESDARKQLAREQRQQQQQQHPFSATSSSSASTSQPQQRAAKPLPPGLLNRVQPQETLASRSSLKRPVPPETQGEVDDDDDSSFSSPPSPPTFWRIGWAEAGALASRLMERRATMDQ